MSCKCDQRDGGGDAAEAGWADALAALDAPGPATQLRDLDADDGAAAEALDDVDALDVADGLDDDDEAVDDALDDDDDDDDDDEAVDAADDDEAVDDALDDDDEAVDADDDVQDAVVAVRQRARGNRGSRVRVISLFDKQAFDFTFLAISTSTVVTLHRALWVPTGYFYWLGLRIHNRDVGRGNLRLDLFETLPSAEDPAEFSAGTAALSATVSSAASDAPPALEVAAATELGPRLKVTLTATQGTGAPLGLYAELSAVLFVRPH